jgi:hypothetical protein
MRRGASAERNHSKFFLETVNLATGIFSSRSRGDTGFLATWQCTHSMGSDAVNGVSP